LKKSLTIIPVRGGSKGIYQKNLQLVNGKSLVERAVLAALQIPKNRIVVSSDDNKILDSVKKYQVERVMRSDENSTDSSTSENVVTEVLSELNISEGIITLLQATNPFVDILSLQKALAYIGSNSSVDSIFSAIEKNTYLWQLKDSWMPIGHEKIIRLPRQLNSRTVVETGSYYIFQAEKFIQEKTRFCGISEPSLTNIWSSFDIDTEEDLIFCQKIGKAFDDTFF
jgi:CMP-N-acetylneuraminic acid synthetase